MWHVLTANEWSNYNIMMHEIYVMCAAASWQVYLTSCG